MTQYMILSAVTSLRPDWKEFVKAPEAPANYKKPEVIADYIRAKMETLEEEVTQSCPSLIHVSSVIYNWSKDLDIGKPSSMADAILKAQEWCFDNGDRLYLIGQKGILQSYVSNPRADDSIELRDLRDAVWTGRITCNSLEELIFTSAERKLLLTDKFLKREPNEPYGRFVIRVLGECGLAAPEQWMLCSESFFLKNPLQELQS